MKNILKLAGVIILNDNKELLLLHRNTVKRTQWEIPGGKVEKDELLENAAIREAREELGVEIKIIKELGNMNFCEDNNTMNYTWFLAHINEGIPQIMEKDKFDILKYWSLNELKVIVNELSPNTQNFLKIVHLE